MSTPRVKRQQMHDGMQISILAALPGTRREIYKQIPRDPSSVRTHLRRMHAAKLIHIVGYIKQVGGGSQQAVFAMGKGRDADPLPVADRIAQQRLRRLQLMPIRTQWIGGGYPAAMHNPWSRMAA